MAAKTRMTLLLGCLVSAASLAQVTGGVVAPATTQTPPPQPAGQLKTGGVLRQTPGDSRQAQQPPAAAPQAQTGPQAQPPNPQVQQVPQQQPLNAPAERKGRNQKDDKGLFGGLF
jgi:hypothetical protein